ncbi:MAG: S8 family serine peptidase [Candidatus Sumerlaeaceae bacterium]|nr:S8 family serine peptidase [Candidatus Sumerlaeaceae bacterium]
MGFQRALRLTLLIVAIFAAAATVSGTPFAGSDVVVKFRAAKDKHDAERAAFARRLVVRKRVLAPGVTVVDGGAAPDALVARLASDPGVEYAFRSRMVQLADTVPNDPLFSNQWQLRNTGQTGGLPGADVKAVQAWDVTTGSASIVIAIVDTGTDTVHPDLSGRLWQNPGEIAGNAIDDDLNGFVDDILGWSFYLNNNNIYDTLGHGTAVAGTAAATTNNGTGVAGVDWNARIMTVACFSPSGSAQDVDVVNGVWYAVDNGAHVVNASWGAPYWSPLFADMARHAQQQGVLIVAAAGNFGFDGDAYPFYPANLASDAILAVGGTDHTDSPLYNYGEQSVGVSAPARLLYHTRFGSAYGTGSGTSYASPMVAGAAAMVLSIAPGMEPNALRHRLMATAAPVAPVQWRNAASGRLDLNAAVRAADLAPPSAITDLATERVGPNGVVLRFTAPGDDGSSGTAAFYDVRVSSEPITAGNFRSAPIAYPYTRPTAAGSVDRIVLNDLEFGKTYYLAVVAVDEAGNAGSISNLVSVTTPNPIMLFDDPCDTTSPVWAASGFSLTTGTAATGTRSWQDSPGALYTTGTQATLTSSGFDISGLARPRLSFYLEHNFPSRLSQGDRLEVQVSADGGSSWTALRKFTKACSPPRRHVVPLDDFAAVTDLRIRFLFVSDDDSFVDDGVYLDDIRLYDGVGAVAEFREQIVESADYFSIRNEPPAYREFPTSDTWTTRSGLKSRAARLESLVARSVTAGTIGAQALFVPLITTPGDYEVFTTWHPTATGAAVPFGISHAGGVTTVTVNQSHTSLANRWVSLGTYRFEYGRRPDSGSVLVDASGASSGEVFADAVLFRLLTPDPPASSVAAWRNYDETPAEHR